MFPSSLILPFANWLLALSQTGILLSIKLLEFLIENWLLLKVIPAPAPKPAPVSVFTDSISISISPFCRVVWVIVVAPACLNLKFPDANACTPEASWVTVLVSVLSISIVFPVWDTATFPPSADPPVKSTSPETNVPVAPPFALVIVSAELYVIVGSPLPSTPWETVAAPPSKNVKFPACAAIPVVLSVVTVSSFLVLISIVLFAVSWDIVAPPVPLMIIAPDCAVPPVNDWRVVIVSVSTTCPERVILFPVLSTNNVKAFDPVGSDAGALTPKTTLVVPAALSVNTIFFWLALCPSAAPSE